MKIQNYIDDIKRRTPSATDIKPVKGGANGIPFSYVVGSEKFFVKYTLSKKTKKNLAENELSICKSIDSDRVVNLRQYGQTKLSGELVNFLIFDFVEGRNLSIELSSAPLPNERLLNIFIGIAHGIMDLCKSGIVHRDIKPANIIISKDDSITIVDLGIAFCIKDDIKASRVNGPLYYSSPEQLQTLLGDSEIFNPELRVSFATDLWSLGLIMYQLATGKYPFDEKDVNRSICEDNVPDPIEINNKLDKKINNIIAKLLNKNPSQRFSHPRQLVEELELILNKQEPDGLNNPFEFFIHQGSHNVFPTNELSSFSKETDIRPDGIIFSARFIPKPSEIFALKECGYKIIIDPETHLLTQTYLASKEAKRTISKLPFYDNSEVPTPITPESSGDDKIKDWWLPEVVNFQDDHLADIILSPYFFVENLKDWIRTNYRLVSATIEHCKNKKIEKPVYLPLCVDGRIIENEKERNIFLDYFFHLDKIEGFYLLIKDDRKSSKPSMNKDLLRGISETIKILGKSKKVILAKGDVSALFCSGGGLSSFSSNQSLSLRRFDYDENIDPDQRGGGRAHKKIFVPSLSNFLREEELQDIKRQKIDLPECNCCFCSKNPDHQYSSHKHYLQHMAKSAKEFSKISSEERVKKSISIISSSKENYKKIAGLQLDSNSMGDFIEIWEEVYSNSN